MKHKNCLPLFYMFTIVLSAMVWSCGREHKRVLEDDELDFVGTWKSVETAKDDAGTVHVIEILELDRNGNYTMSADISIDVNAWRDPMKSEGGYYVSGRQLEDAITGNYYSEGQWSVEGKDLLLSPKPGSSTVSFSKSGKAHLVGVSGKMPSGMNRAIDDMLSDMEDMKGEFLDELAGEERYKILKHTEYTLKIKDDDGEVVEYTRE